MTVAVAASVYGIGKIAPNYIIDCARISDREGRIFQREANIRLEGCHNCRKASSSGGARERLLGGLSIMNDNSAYKCRCRREVQWWGRGYKPHAPNGSAIFGSENMNLCLPLGELACFGLGTYPTNPPLAPPLTKVQAMGKKVVWRWGHWGSYPLLSFSILLGHAYIPAGMQEGNAPK